MPDMYSPDRPSGFDSVDTSKDPAAFSAYLKGVAGLGVVQAYITRSIELLGLGAGDSFAEVGCGVAHDLPYLARAIGASGNIILIDNSAEMLNAAAREAAAISGECPQIRIQNADAHSLPVETGTLDAIRVVRVLQHLKDPQQVLGEMMRVLKTGGKLCAIEPDWTKTTIASNDRETTDIFLADIHRAIRHPSIGNQLLRLCAELGMRTLNWEVLTHNFQSMDEASKPIIFGARLDNLVSKGLLKREKADAWLADLRSRSADGSFSVTMSLGLLVAEKDLGMVQGSP